MQLQNLARAARAYRQGAPLGDVVLLKLSALSSPSARVSEAIARAPATPEVASLQALRGLKPGSFGREYARFLDANGIDPIVVSESSKRRVEASAFAVRYTETHDLHHVITGFDAGLAGEIGVLAFNHAQGSAPLGRLMFYVAGLIYSVVSPTQVFKIWHNVRVGIAMGKSAALVIAAPLEGWFEEPLADVREKLAVSDPLLAGVVKSRTSLLASLVYPARR